MINKCDIKDFRAWHSTTGMYILFPKSHITFTKTNDNLSLEVNLNNSSLSETDGREQCLEGVVYLEGHQNLSV